MTLKANISSTLILFCLNIAIAQNLVSNGGFESYQQLPQREGIFSVAQWKNPCGAQNTTYDFGTPDYLHRKGTGECKLPNSAKGMVSPQEGDAVVGLITYNGTIPNFREYISVELKTPLNPGQKYAVSFYLSNGLEAFQPYYKYISNGLGVLFTDTLPSQNGNQRIDTSPHYAVNSIVYARDWKKIIFIHQAESAQKFITLGNFFDDQQTKSKKYTDDGGFPYAYYFIDNVSVEALGVSPSPPTPTQTQTQTPVNYTVEAGPDQITCGTDFKLKLSANISPSTPNTTAFNWSGGNGKFGNSQELNTTYIPSINEVGKKIKLYFGLSTGQVDSLYVIINDPVVKVDAGKDQIINANQFVTAPLEARVLLYTGKPGRGRWSGGSGQFSDPNDPNATYKPATTEIGKTVVLKFTALDPDAGGPCEGGKSDEVHITIKNQAPTKDQDPTKNQVEATTDQAPPHVGQVIPMENIFFESNKYDILDKSFPSLDKIYDFLRQYQGMVVEISGHTNNLCTSAWCAELSLNRAKAVRAYFISKGIPENRMRSAGYGKKFPIADNTTRTGRAKNQRVELKVLEIN